MNLASSLLGNIEVETKDDWTILDSIILMDPFKLEIFHPILASAILNAEYFAMIEIEINCGKIERSYSLTSRYIVKS